MKKETEQFLTEQGLWNYADNIKVSREKLAELLENYEQTAKDHWEPKWIPASEPPDTLRNILTNIGGVVSFGYYSQSKKSYYDMTDTGNYKPIEVISWMELPSTNI